MKKSLALFGVMFLLAGCCHQKFDLGNQRATIPTYEGTSHFVFWGLGQTQTVDPNEICGNRGIASVETGQSFWQGFAASLTWGIYNPMEYRIYCNAANMAQKNPTTSNQQRNYYRYDGYGY